MNPVDRPILAMIFLGLFFVAMIVLIRVIGYFARRRFLRQVASLDQKKDMKG